MSGPRSPGGTAAFAPGSSSSRAAGWPSKRPTSWRNPAEVDTVACEAFSTKEVSHVCLLTDSCLAGPSQPRPGWRNPAEIATAVPCCVSSYKLTGHRRCSHRGETWRKSPSTRVKRPLHKRNRAKSPGTFVPGWPLSVPPRWRNPAETATTSRPRLAVFRSARGSSVTCHRYCCARKARPARIGTPGCRP